MHWSELLSSQRITHKPVQANMPVDRSAFEQDLDRIIFSHPFRRLQDKTQVHPLPEYDFVHTRLTHSLEVSSVGRSLGRRVGEALFGPGGRYQNIEVNSYDIGTIVAAASLAHDLGNPPFGHSGETSISDFFNSHPLGEHLRTAFSSGQWGDVTNFEGNAEGFRILNKAGQGGLRLTAATLAAFSKYPRESVITSRDKDRCSQKKYGFFQTEKAVFAQVAGFCGMPSIADEKEEHIYIRHPLAFLVEAADDICYSIIDLEDGCRLGLISFDEYVTLLAPILGDQLNPEKLERYTDVNEKLGVLRAMTIGKLIAQCVELFLDEEHALLDGRFDQPLSEQITASGHLDVIGAVSVSKIYRCRQVVERELAGYEILTGLLERFMTAVLSAYEARKAGRKVGKSDQKTISLMPQEVNLALTSNTSLYELTMLVLDAVAGMTDSYAVNLYRKIKGIAI